MGRETETSLKVAVLLLSLLCAEGYTAPLSPSDRDSIQQQQSELLRREQAQRDELERSIPLPSLSAPVSTPSASGPCFKIHDISLDG